MGDATERGLVDLIEGLPDRFIGGADDLRARFRLVAGGLVRDIVVDRDHCRVSEPEGNADTEILADATTWRDIDAGRLSGIEAFTRRQVRVRGSIERALHFETLFDRPSAGGFRYSLEHLPAGGHRVSALVAGADDAPPLFLLHGLGGTKASWLTVVPQLSRHFRVFAVDFPGFGASSKPLGRYNAAWFADRVVELLDGLGLNQAFVAGNSMGGRVAIELGIGSPDRVSAIACLCPATAFSHRPGVGLVRLMRPEFGMLLGRLPRKRLARDLRQLFAEPTRIDDAWYRAAVDDFMVTWRSPRARLAFFSAARNIYLDEPYGDDGFWARLASMQPPSLFIYGEHDFLITPRFGLKVKQAIPSAQVQVWDDSGHVPQLEHPDRTADALVAFFDAGAAGAAEMAG